MRTLLAELHDDDVEHGAAWAVRDEWTLEWNVDGRLVLDHPDLDGCSHLAGVSRERALELWVALVSGRLEEVQRCAWQPGNGFVVTEEHERAIREAQEAADREFWNILGPERTTERCHESGCTRGAISQSLFCRVHHFEVVMRRACPFKV